MIKKLNYNKNQGFSLLEMAVVLVILGFVIGALLLPLQAQRNVLFQSETENTLENARVALLGYAQKHGRLPCPATAISNTDAGSLGQENPLGGTHNTTPPIAVPECEASVGFLPAATLGIQPTDASGFALDAWNNRIRYAVATDDSSTRRVPPVTGPLCGGDSAPDFTTIGNIATVGMACLNPNLRVCHTSTVITSTACSAGTETNYHINDAVAVIYSIGPTGSLAVGGADENANLNDADANGEIDDGVFVSHEIAASNAPNGEFDHLVVWISPYTLYNAMIEAGQLH